MVKRVSLQILSVVMLLGALASLGWPETTWAMSLAEAKQQGLVGETPGGYLGIVVKNPSAEVKALVKDINDRRKKKYKEIARRNKTELAAVEALAGKKAIDKTPSGEYVKLTTGRWARK